MMAKRTRDPEATREALLDAAEEIFLEKGFGRTSMSEIARRAGITKSLIHHYFGSKKGIWNEVKTRRFEYYAQEQMKILEQTVPSEEMRALKASVDIYFWFLKDNPQIVKILAWMFLEGDKEDVCIEKDRELIEIGGALMKEAQKAGRLRDDIDPRFILFTFIGLCQHWFQNRNHFISDFGVEGLPEDLDSAYLEALTKIFFEGIAPRS